MTLVGRQNNYLDPLELELQGDVNVDDPLELAAMTAHRMTFTVPEEAGSMIGRPQSFVETWLALAPEDRQLWRRRADITIAAWNGERR